MADAAAKGDGRLLFDALSALLLLLVAVLGAYMPKYLAFKGSLQQGTASSLAFHLGNMLSGGVMLSAGFCHLLADALRHLAFVGRFPMAPFLAATGYLITLLADQIVQLLTTDAEGHQQQEQQQQLGSPGFWPPPPAGPGSSLGLGSSSRPGPRSGRASAAPSPAGAGSAGFAGFLRGGLAGQKAGWGGYSRLEEDAPLMQQQQYPGSSSCQEGGIELSVSSLAGHNSSSRTDTAGTATGNGCSSQAADAGPMQQQQQQHGCSQHTPGSCPCCCPARGSVPDAEGSAGPQNPGSTTGQAAAAVGYSRRPGSAGGLDSAGLGLGAMARTRSLASPSSVVGPALSPLQAAAARELGSGPASGGAAAAAAPVSGWHAGAADAGSAAGTASGNPAAAAAAAVPLRPLLPVSTTPASLQDNATCLLAAGSPRSVSAAGLHPRSPKVKSAAAAAGLIHQQQQQQQQHANGHHHSQQQADVQPPMHPPLPLQQQQQQQMLSPSEQQQQRAAGSGSFGQLLLQPVRQLSLPTQGCGAPSCCCCASAGCRSGLPSAQPDMTEACTVARVAGHLELEVMSTATGGHNHGHFQVFLSQRPLSFATSLLLACALCIHSILEGLALGAQQSMQATEDIMLAIAAHKGLAAYALGASIVESRASDSKFWVVVCLFAAATPLGIGIGYASSVLGHGPVSAAMSALASGTFLYVALNEVIPKELEHPDGHRLAKVAALLLGFGLMSLLALWA